MTSYQILDMNRNLLFLADLVSSYPAGECRFAAMARGSLPEIASPWFEVTLWHRIGIRAIEDTSVEFTLWNGDEGSPILYWNTPPGYAPTGEVIHRWEVGWPFDLDELRVSAMTDRPYRRVYPRDDGRAGGAQRQWPTGGRSKQQSNRVGGTYI